MCCIIEEAEEESLRRCAKELELYPGADMELRTSFQRGHKMERVFLGALKTNFFASCYIGKNCKNSSAGYEYDRCFFFSKKGYQLNTLSRFNKLRIYK